MTAGRITEDRLTIDYVYHLAKQKDLASEYILIDRSLSRLYQNWDRLKSVLNFYIFFI